ncbi:hypothetical protein JHW43_001691 [Diplocarpon mali]|nr:hypothetical protein JHW43_001691 [Diplocarpon mali]
MVSDGKPRVSNPPYVPLPPPTSSHVCITPLIPGSVDLIALAGLAGFITSDSSSPKTIKDQAPIANSKIKSCLTAAGATPRDMVQMKHYTARETGDPEQDDLDVVSDLIWLYTSKNFGGFEYQAYGNYKTCQNLPNYWDRNTHSLKCNVNPSVICCIYTDKNCNTVGHDATTVATEVAELIGYYEGTRSFMCNERIDESSTCDGAPVQGHI